MHESPFAEDGGGIYTGSSSKKGEVSNNLPEIDYKATIYHPYIKADNVRQASSVYLRELVCQAGLKLS